MFRMTSGVVARRIAVAIAGVGAATAIAAGGVANAAPPQPPKAAPAHPHKAAPAPTTMVPGTACTLAQVERALGAEDPQLWHEISSHPRAKRHFEQTIVLTPEQRKQRRLEAEKHHPERAEIMNFLRDHGIGKKDRAEHRAAIKKAMETCGNYK